MLGSGLKSVVGIAAAISSAPPGGESFFGYVSRILAGMAQQLSTSLFRIMEMMDRIVGREVGDNYVKKAAQEVMKDVGTKPLQGKLGEEIEALKGKLKPYFEA